MKKSFLYLCVLIGVAGFFFAADKYYQKKTKFGLQAKFCSPTFSTSAEWEFPPLDDAAEHEVNQLLSQKFTYFARGSQAFAFISEDGRYILKLFKQHKWRPGHLLGYIPLPLNPYYKEALHRKKKELDVLRSCKAALLHVKEDTGVLFAHLNPTPLSVRSVSVVDKQGKAWRLNLSRSCFLLQKRADLFHPHINAWMEKGDLEGAQHAIDSLLHLCDRFIKKGVHSNNTIFRKNFGFIDNEAVQFDIGKFKCDPLREQPKDSLRVQVNHFYNWIKNTYPSLVSHFEAKLEELCPKEPATQQ